MPNVQIQIDGLNKLRERLKNSPKVTKPILAKTINLGLAEIPRNARDPQFLFKTPRSERTGYLELSFSEAAALIKYATPDNLQGSIGPSAKYAIYVHEGTSKSQGNPFMLRIIAKSQPKIDELFTRALEKITEELAN